MQEKQKDASSRCHRCASNPFCRRPRRLVQMRTRIMNQLKALAMNEGQRRKKKLWSEAGRAQLEKLPLAPWASWRRQDLPELRDRMIQASVS
jgi:transposase